MADCAISISVFTPFVNRYKTYICAIETMIVVKKFLSVLKYLLFLAIGLAVFYYIYREVEFRELMDQVSSINWWWIALSLLVSIIGHIFRAIRWCMLIDSAGYSVNRFRTFCSVMVMYFVNLIIPRGGEIVRCTVLSQTDRVPFAVLLGTVVVERVVDVIILLIVTIFMVLFQLNFIESFVGQLDSDAIFNRFAFLFSPFFWIAAVALGGVTIAVLYKFRHKLLEIKLLKPVVDLMLKFWNGIKSILRLKHWPLFLLFSLLVYLAYFTMFYVAFFSFAPTSGLSFGVAVTTIIVGAFAMLVPVQGGIGPWHFMVFQTLAVYGVQIADGKIYALISHSTTNGICLILGAISLVYLTVIGRRVVPQSKTDTTQAN